MSLNMSLNMSLIYGFNYSIQPIDISYSAKIVDIYAACELIQKYKIDTNIDNVRYLFPVDGELSLYDIIIKMPI